MDFSLTAKQQELIGLAKEISEKEIAPRALDIDKSGVMDEDLLNILKQSGMTTLAVPAEYGGPGLDLLTVAGDRRNRKGVRWCCYCLCC